MFVPVKLREEFVPNDSTGEIGNASPTAASSNPDKVPVIVTVLRLDSVKELATSYDINKFLQVTAEVTVTSLPLVYTSSKAVGVGAEPATPAGVDAQIALVQEPFDVAYREAPEAEIDKTNKLQYTSIFIKKFNSDQK